MFNKNLQGFTEALNVLRGIPAESITSAQVNGNTVVTVSLPDGAHFPAVTITPRGKFDMTEVPSYVEDGTANAFLACVYGDWHYATKRRSEYPYDRANKAGKPEIAKFYGQTHETEAVTEATTEVSVS